MRKALLSTALDPILALTVGAAAGLLVHFAIRGLCMLLFGQL